MIYDVVILIFSAIKGGLAVLHLFHWFLDFKHPKGYRIDRPNGMDVYSFLLFQQPVTIEQNGESILTEENTGILYEKWIPQCYYNERSDYWHDGFFFDGEEVPPLIQKLGLPLNKPFSVKNSNVISAMIREAAAEALRKETYSAEIVSLRLEALFYKLADLLLHQASYSHSYYPQFRQIRDDIYCHPERRWRAQDLSEELHLSLSRFQHLYKAFFSTTLNKDVIKGRIEHAQYLLKSDTSIAAVAETCGYRNTEHFIRQFKKSTGISPGDYRKRHFQHFLKNAPQPIGHRENQQKG